ncbi:MAG: hypothetical protein H6591_11835 [Flavobacteriales bacterium]|nr:hypothetical protein [Flavobacteriales bacterium]
MRPLFTLISFFATLTLAAQPPNDACEGAIDISCNSVIQGTTTDATTDAVDACGTSITAPGAWFRLVGSGQEVVVTTCPDNTYDTKLNVYAGACDGLVCITGNDDIEQGVFCSSAGFVAEEGITYYILVQGYDGATGDFELSVTCTAITQDHCQGALPIACGQTVQGSTADATADEVPECGTSITAPGVWYSFTGNGGQMILSTCPDNTFDTKLNVYTGPCSAPVCVAGNDDSVPGVYCSTLAFTSTPGTAYFVLVQGYDGATGTFDLSLTCPDCGAPTDVIITATDATAQVTWNSPNESSSFLVEYGPVGFTPGTGMTISGATGITGPPVNINGLAPGTEYDVYVSEECLEGGGPAAGPIGFTTLTEPLAENAQCSGAITIACGGSVEGDTGLGLPAAGPTCGAANITSTGLWYTFIGTGEDATLSTCGASGYDTKISVFSGACDALLCEAGSDDGPNCPGNTSSLTMHTTGGTTYLVLVHGYQEDQGHFTLTLECADPCAAVDNDDCSNASLLTVQPAGGCESSTGTTACAFATSVPNPPCDAWGNIVDTWYAFNTGWAQNLSLIIERGTAEYVNAALYTACDEPAYIDCWTDVNGPIALQGIAPNTELLVRVWNGGGAGAGTFSICVEGDFNVGVAEVARASFLASPVPASDVLTLRGLDGVASITLVDATGRVVRSLSVNSSRALTFGVQDLAEGLYLVNGDGRQLGRVLIQH